MPVAGVELAVPVPVAVIGALGAALAVSGAAQRVGFGAHQGVDERGQQLAQHIGVGGGESFGQHRRPVDIVGSGHRVDSFARVTLDGLSKNHAMTFNHSATTRRHLDQARLVHHSAGRNRCLLTSRILDARYKRRNSCQQQGSTHQTSGASGPAGCTEVAPLRMSSSNGDAGCRRSR